MVHIISKEKLTPSTLIKKTSQSSTKK